MRAGEDRVNKHIDEVKGEMKDFKEQVRDDMRAGEAREPLNKPESSAIRLLPPLSLLVFPKALRVSRGLVQRFPRTNKRIDEVKEETKEVKVEMKEFKQEMGEIKTLLIQALRLPPPAQP